MAKAKPFDDVRLWLHCEQCLDELPVGTSPKEYSKQQIGISDTGEAVVWCNRHDVEIVRLQLSDEEIKHWQGCSCTECNCEETKH